MIYIIWGGIILFTIIIQGSITFLDVTPNLTVILVYYFGIKKGAIKGIFFGAFIGLIEDILSSNLFIGYNFLSKGLVGYLSSTVTNKIFIWTPILGIISISLFTFMDSCLVFTSKTLFQTMPMKIGAALFVVLIQSLMNAPLGIFIKPKEVL